MKLKTLGSTQLQVSRIGLGLAALGRPGYINLGHADDLGENYAVSAMRRRAHTILDLAFERGVRYFDAARSYGRAESFLGLWLEGKGLAPEDVVVGSKWGYTYTADWKVEAEVHEVKEHTLSVLRKQWEESRETLGDHLDVYQIHSATLKSGVLENEAILDQLAKLKGEGVVIGLTVSGPGQGDVIDRALPIEMDGIRLFDTVQATWNILEISAGPALARAHREGMGVVIKEALANGRLTSKNEDPDFVHQRSLLEEVAARLSSTVDGLALAAALAQPWADVVLSGAAQKEHLISNLGALEVVWDREADERTRGLVEPPQVYWDKRSQLSWN